MTACLRVLVADRLDLYHYIIAEALGDRAHEIIPVLSYEDGLAQIEGGVDLVVAELHLQTDCDGLHLCAAIRDRLPSAKILVHTDTGDETLLGEAREVATLVIRKNDDDLAQRVQELAGPPEHRPGFPRSIRRIGGNPDIGGIED